MTTHDTIAILKHLIATLEDGKEGYRHAADTVEDKDLAATFRIYEEQRAGYSSELHEVAAALGDASYDATSSVAAALHRSWMDLRAMISGKDRRAILSECERGEDQAVAAFHKALEQDLPGNVRAVVERQAAAIKEAHDTVKELRDSTPPTTETVPTVS